jgi:hypothetical protein
MRVLLPTYGSCGDVEPLGGPAKLRTQVRACATPDCAEWLAGVGMLVPMGVCR